MYFMDLYRLTRFNCKAYFKMFSRTTFCFDVIFKMVQVVKTNYYIPWQPEFSMEFNSLNNFGIASCKKHSCKVSTNLAEWLKRRSCLKKLLTHWRTHGQTLDNGPSQKLTLWTLSSGELKNLPFWFSKYHRRIQMSNDYSLASVHYDVNCIH